MAINGAVIGIYYYVNNPQNTNYLLKASTDVSLFFVFISILFLGASIFLKPSTMIRWSAKLSIFSIIFVIAFPIFVGVMRISFSGMLGILEFFRSAFTIDKILMLIPAR